jgi:hypothetical protein
LRKEPTTMYSRMAANPGFYPDPVPETRRYVVKPDSRRKGAWRVCDAQNGMSVIASRWFAKPETAERFAYQLDVEAERRLLSFLRSERPGSRTA